MTRLVVDPPARLPRLPARVHPLVLVARRGEQLLAGAALAPPVGALLLPAKPVLPSVRAVGQHDARLVRVRVRVRVRARARVGARARVRVRVGVRVRVSVRGSTMRASNWPSTSTCRD